jgi:hypothetical protein
MHQCVRSVSKADSSCRAPYTEIQCPHKGLVIMIQFRFWSSLFCAREWSVADGLGLKRMPWASLIRLPQGVCNWHNWSSAAHSLVLKPGNGQNTEDLRGEPYRIHPPHNWQTRQLCSIQELGKRAKSASPDFHISQITCFNFNLNFCDISFLANFKRKKRNY